MFQGFSLRDQPHTGAARFEGTLCRENNATAPTEVERLASPRTEQELVVDYVDDRSDIEAQHVGDQPIARRVRLRRCERTDAHALRQFGENRTQQRHPSGLEEREHAHDEFDLVEATNGLSRRRDGGKRAGWAIESRGDARPSGRIRLPRVSHLCHPRLTDEVRLVRLTHSLDTCGRDDHHG